MHTSTAIVAGSDFDEVNDVAVAPDGGRVLCGVTRSPDFPVVNALDDTLDDGDQNDVFIVRLASDDETVEFATYFGGTGFDSCTRIAIDSHGDIVFAGRTTSDDFPIVSAYDGTFAGNEANDTTAADGFLVKITGDGSTIVFSTYVGGEDIAGVSANFSTRETIRGLVIDDADRIFVAGNTGAPDFPALNVIDGRQCMSGEAPFLGIGSDLFVARFSSTGVMEESACYGGVDRDAGRAIALGQKGEVFVGGWSWSSGFPVTPGAIADYDDLTFTSEDVVVVRLNNDLTTVLSSARFGGDWSDWTQDLHVAANGNVLAVGSTASQDFPVTPGALQADIGSVSIEDAFIAGLLPDLSAFEFATYHGGAGYEYVFSSALDDNDQIWLYGATDSFDAFDYKAFQSQKAGDATALLPVSGATGNATGYCRGFQRAVTDQDGNVITPPFEFFAVGRDGINDRLRNSKSGFISEGSLGGTATDTRGVACFDFNGDGSSDVVFANYNGANTVFLTDGAGGYLPPVQFGDVAGKSVGIAISDGQEDLIAVIAETGPTTVYDADDGGAFVASDTFGASGLGAKAVANWGFGFVTINNDDTLEFYHPVTQGTVTQSTAPLPGARALIVEDFDLDDIDDVVVARDGFRSALLTVGPGLPPNLVIATQLLDEQMLDATGVARVTIAPIGIAFSRSNGMINYYRWEAGNNLVLRQTFDSGIVAPNVGPTPGSWDVLLTSGPGAPVKVSLLWPFDAFLSGFRADGTRLLASSYLGGHGSENTLWGIAIHPDSDQILLGGRTQAPDFPLGGLPPANLVHSVGYLARVQMPPDTDSDGVSGLDDNCLNDANPDQTDTDGDGYGNRCDGDFNNDGIVNATDLGVFRSQFFTDTQSPNWDAVYDLTVDGSVNVQDLGVLRTLFFKPPGPSSH